MTVSLYSMTLTWIRIHPSATSLSEQRWMHGFRKYRRRMTLPIYSSTTTEQIICYFSSPLGKSSVLSVYDVWGRLNDGVEWMRTSLPVLVVWSSFCSSGFWFCVPAVVWVSWAVQMLVSGVWQEDKKREWPKSLCRSWSWTKGELPSSLSLSLKSWIYYSK